MFLGQSRDKEHKNHNQFVSRKSFDEELAKIYKDRYTKPEWTKERVKLVMGMIEKFHHVDITKPRALSAAYYRYAKLYEVMKKGEQKILIIKRKNETDPACQIVPSDEYYDILSEIHNNNKHAGREKMLLALKFNYIIPKSALDAFLRLCQFCRTRKAPPRPDLNPIVSYKPRKVVQEIEKIITNRGRVDLIDLDFTPDGDYKWILHYQENWTKFSFLRPLVLDNEVEVAMELLKVFLEVGCPAVLESSNGPEFTEGVISILMDMWPSCKIVNACTKYMNNEESIQAVKDTERLIETWMRENNSINWATGLYFIQYQKNCAFHKGIRKTPFKALLDRDPTNSATSIEPELSTDLLLPIDLGKFSLDQTKKRMPKMLNKRYKIPIKSDKKKTSEKGSKDCEAPTNSINSKEPKLPSNLPDDVANLNVIVIGPHNQAGNITNHNKVKKSQEQKLQLGSEKKRKRKSINKSEIQSKQKRPPDKMPKNQTNWASQNGSHKAVVDRKPTNSVEYRLSSDLLIPNDLADIDVGPIKTQRIDEPMISINPHSNNIYIEEEIQEQTLKQSTKNNPKRKRLHKTKSGKPIKQPKEIRENQKFCAFHNCNQKVPQDRNPENSVEHSNPTNIGNSIEPEFDLPFPDDLADVNVIPIEPQRNDGSEIITKSNINADKHIREQIFEQDAKNKISHKCISTLKSTYKSEHQIIVNKSIEDQNNCAFHHDIQNVLLDRNITNLENSMVPELSSNLLIPDDLADVNVVPIEPQTIDGPTNNNNSNIFNIDEKTARKILEQGAKSKRKRKSECDLEFRNKKNNTSKERTNSDISLKRECFSNQDLIMPSDLADIKLTGFDTESIKQPTNNNKPSNVYNKDKKTEELMEAKLKNENISKSRSKKKKASDIISNYHTNSNIPALFSKPHRLVPGNIVDGNTAVVEPNKIEQSPKNITDIDKKNSQQMFEAQNNEKSTSRCITKNTLEKHLDAPKKSLEAKLSLDLLKPGKYANINVVQIVPQRIEQFVNNNPPSNIVEINTKNKTQIHDQGADNKSKLINENKSKSPSKDEKEPDKNTIDATTVNTLKINLPSILFLPINLSNINVAGFLPQRIKEPVNITNHNNIYIVGDKPKAQIIEKVVEDKVESKKLKSESKTKSHSKKRKSEKNSKEPTNSIKLNLSSDLVLPNAAGINMGTEPKRFTQSGNITNRKYESQIFEQDGKNRLKLKLTKESEIKKVKPLKITLNLQNNKCLDS